MTTKRFSGFRSLWTDTFLVGGGETSGNLEGVVHGLSLGDGPLIELLAQRLAVQELRDRERYPVDRPKSKIAKMFGCGKRRDRLCLALEPRQGSEASSRHSRRQDLQRHLPVQSRVLAR